MSGFLKRVFATNFLIRNIAFRALLAKSFCAWYQLPVGENTIPRYLNCDTTEMGLFLINHFSDFAGFPPLRKTTIHVLDRFIVRWNLAQYFSRQFKNLWRPIGVYENKTRSSAKRRWVIEMFPRNISWPSTFSRYFLISFMNRLNSRGLRRHPCLSPLNNCTVGVRPKGVNIWDVTLA